MAEPFLISLLFLIAVWQIAFRGRHRLREDVVRRYRIQGKDEKNQIILFLSLALEGAVLLLRTELPPWRKEG